jgi:hypothetical protein
MGFYLKFTVHSSGFTVGLNGWEAGMLGCGNAEIGCQRGQSANEFEGARRRTLKDLPPLHPLQRGTKKLAWN